MLGSRAIAGTRIAQPPCRRARVRTGASAGTAAGADRISSGRRPGAGEIGSTAAGLDRRSHRARPEADRRDRGRQVLARRDTSRSENMTLCEIAQRRRRGPHRDDPRRPRPGPGVRPRHGVRHGRQVRQILQRGGLQRRRAFKKETGITYHDFEMTARPSASRRCATLPGGAPRSWLRLRPGGRPGQGRTRVPRKWISG